MSQWLWGCLDGPWACGLSSLCGRGRSGCHWPETPRGAAGEEGPASETPWLWGAWGQPPLHLLPSPGRTLESSMLSSGPKDLSSVQGNDGLFWSPSPHSCSSGHYSPFSLSPGIPTFLSPHPQKPQQPHFKNLFTSSFYYFPYPCAPAPYMSFLRAPCPPHFLRGSPSPIS